MIALGFFTSGDVAARTIQAVTWSPWDHVGFLLPDGRLLSAMPGRGVEYSRQDLRRTKMERLVFSGVGSEREILGAAASQLGKPYDWSAVLGIGLHRDWRSPDRWFCSELVAWAFERAGRPLLRADRLDRITPATLATSVMLQPI